MVGAVTKRWLTSSRGPFRYTDRACSEVGNGFEIAASRDARACVLLRVVSRGLDPVFSAL